MPEARSPGPGGVQGGNEGKGRAGEVQGARVRSAAHPAQGAVVREKANDLALLTGRPEGGEFIARRPEGSLDNDAVQGRGHIQGEQGRSSLRRRAVRS